jgi:hypothetical protein
VDELARCPVVFEPADPPRLGRMAFWGAELPTGMGELGALDIVEAHEHEVRVRTVPAVRLPVAEAVPLLSRARRDRRAHPATAFWGAATVVALQLVARGRLQPTVSHDDYDAWRVGPLDPADQGRIGELVAAMPAGARAVPVPGRLPLELPDAQRLVEGFLDAVADGMPRGGSEAAFLAATPRRVPELRAWADGVSVSLRIEFDGRFRAVVQLHSVSDPGVVSDAAEVWAGAGRARAQAQAVVALRRAARVWPALDSLLHNEVPDEITLTDDEVRQLLGGAADRLTAKGVPVHWPKELARQLVSRVAIGGDSPPRGLPGFLGGEQALRFDWQIAVGDDPLTRDELEQLAQAHRPVVRLREQWQLVDADLARRVRQRELEPLNPLAALGLALTGAAEVDGEQIEVVPNGWLAALRDRIADAEGGSERLAQPPALAATLRDYQLRGLRWLARMTELGLGCCLADDMGLGKTITVIALHLHRATSPMRTTNSAPASPTAASSTGIANLSSADSDSAVASSAGAINLAGIINLASATDSAVASSATASSTAITNLSGAADSDSATASSTGIANLAGTAIPAATTNPAGTAIPTGTADATGTANPTGAASATGTVDPTGAAGSTSAAGSTDASATGVAGRTGTANSISDAGPASDDDPDRAVGVTRATDLIRAVDSPRAAGPVRAADPAFVADPVSGGGLGPAGGPTLVVCPASLLGNWEREIRRFAPGVPVRRFHGSARDLTGVEGFVLTTYGTMRLDAAELAAVQWDLVVADEAQHVKNARSATAKALRTIGSGVRVALTGTPVENTLSELWAILDWAAPGLLGSLGSFRRRWAKPIEADKDEETARRFARLLRPFLLRRSKSDPGIAPELPAKTETDQLVPLTREQAGLYEATVREAMAEIAESDGMARRGLIIKLLTSLKQICNHPAQYLKQGDARLTGRSGKLALLDELLDTIVAEDHAVLVFTQYVAMAQLLSRHLADRGLSSQLLHGGTPVTRREDMVRRFQDGEVPIFLISLKAGGTGLNLTQADHVVHYDRWWNPAVEDQATDRAYRIGQTRPVQVHRLMTEGTIEDRIAAMLAAKRALADAVLTGGEAALTELSDAELADLVELR